MPGDFNTACRILFCSTGKPASSDDDTDTGRVGFVLYEDKKIKDGVGHESLSFHTTFLVPTNFDAERVFKVTMAIWEPELHYRINEMDTSPLRIVSTFTNAFEVLEVVFPDPAVAEQYSRAALKHAEQGKSRRLGPVGYLVLKPTILEDGWDRRAAIRSADEIISVYMDQDVLRYLQPGMKMRLTICELDFGMKFIKGAGEVFPTFYEFLPQSLMLQWKTPRLDHRPPPSAEDLDAAEKKEAQDMENEEREMLQEQRKVDGELNRELQELEDVRMIERSMDKLRFQ